MKESVKMPPTVAWDFRKVSDLALEDATLFEYARSSDKIRTAIWKCLQTKTCGKKIADHILSALKIITVDRRPFPDCFPDGVYRLISSGLEKATCGNFKLMSVIFMRPDFPMPWMACQISLKPHLHHSRIIINRFNGDGIGEYQLSFLPLHGATIKDLVNDFEKWLRNEVRTDSKRFSVMKKRGKSGQLPIARLTWLAAYRISKAGVSYVKAQNFLEPYPNHYGHLPKYVDKSGWSDAIRKAKNFLSKVESGQI